jgi:hypothetical protein
MQITFFDRSGRPVAYTTDGVYIYLFNGKPVAYVRNESVYSFPGKHLGWFLNGWIRDHSGACAFFTESATGGPVKPVKRTKPVKGVKGIKPIKGTRQIKPIKAIKSLSWSALTGEPFFYQ